MKFEINENDPLYNTLERMWDILTVNGLLLGLINKAESKFSPQEGQQVASEVVLLAMRMWLKDLKEKVHNIQYYNAGEMARDIEGNLETAIATIRMTHPHRFGRRPVDR